MNQTLFSFNQNSELARVSGNTAPLVQKFLESKGVNGEFHASELYHYCETQIKFLAPGSSCRVLRQMKSSKLVGYEVVNRQSSKYRITELNF